MNSRHDLASEARGSVFRGNMDSRDYPPLALAQTLPGRRKKRGGQVNIDRIEMRVLVSENKLWPPFLRVPKGKNNFDFYILYRLDWNACSCPYLSY